MKIISWGYPLNTHTQSYIQGAFYKAAKSLGHEAYWFHDGDFPEQFDWSGSVFWCEGYADKNVPLRPDCTYFVHCCVNPEKYLNAGARLIDVRFNVDTIKDNNYTYDTKLLNLEIVDQCLKYERKSSSTAITSRAKDLPELNYESVYITWATDLLPEEINFDWVNVKRTNQIIWIGSIHRANRREIEPFAVQCSNYGIQFMHSDPWSRPLTFEDCMRVTQDSFLAPDIRGSGDSEEFTGTNHLKIGYVACRQFKNISYGHLGGGNLQAANSLMDGTLVTNLDTAQLFHDMLAKKEDLSLIRNQMQIVKEKHTWQKRVSDLLSLV